jgi:hypothetical protein
MGNIWPLDYSDVMPDDETKSFRLKCCESRKSIEDTNMLFVNVDESESKVYHSKLEIDSRIECCTIEYYGIGIVLRTDRGELACKELA